MTQPPAPRTRLAQLLRERHWTVDDFVREFNRAGRHSGPDRRDHAISHRQATRWQSGRLPSLPHPASCRVLEAMFGFDARYALTPHADLVAPIERAWTDAEALLDTRITGPTRTDLELVAGQYAYNRGQLAFDMGDNKTALTFLVLAAQHAHAVGDTLLAGSVAVMRSAVAFFAGDFAAAAALARRTLPGAHPYVVPTLASSLARALAQTGDAEGALIALRTMHDNIWTGPLLPGPEPGDEETYEAFSAVTLGYVGRGEDAEHHGLHSLALLAGTGRFVQQAGTQLALARAFLRRQTPDPERAATAVQAALRAATGNSHPRTTDRASAIYRRLTANPDWSRLSVVCDLAAQLPASPRALPSASVI